MSAYICENCQKIKMFTFSVLTDACLRPSKKAHSPWYSDNSNP